MHTLLDVIGSSPHFFAAAVITTFFFRVRFYVCPLPRRLFDFFTFFFRSYSSPPHIRTLQSNPFCIFLMRWASIRTVCGPLYDLPSAIYPFPWVTPLPFFLYDGTDGGSAFSDFLRCSTVVGCCCARLITHNYRLPTSPRWLRRYRLSNILPTRPGPTLLAHGGLLSL